ncbi:MAG: DUF3253 domain-containing protein [Planctomycetota bacterium]
MTPQEAILSLLAKRGPGKTICPSEAARTLDPVDWRDRMGEVRSAAEAMADAGQLMFTQRGEAVHARTARGPIRLRLP